MEAGISLIYNKWFIYKIYQFNFEVNMNYNFTVF